VAADFECSLIRDLTQAGRALPTGLQGRKGRQDGLQPIWKNLPVGRPKRIFNRERVFEMWRNGASIRVIAKNLGVGVGTVTRTLQPRAKIS
jgi:hypothetical protein